MGRVLQLVDGSDIALHLPMLEVLAMECEVVLELGTRGGESTRALLAGAGKVISVDIDRCDVPGFSNWDFRQQDSREEVVDEFDGLFIDSRHTFSHVLEELRVHGKRAKRWIALHDTWLYGLVGEDNASPGLEAAVEEFLKENPEWRVAFVSIENNGLTVLRREGKS